MTCLNIMIIYYNIVYVFNTRYYKIIIYSSISRYLYIPKVSYYYSLYPCGKSIHYLNAIFSVINKKILIEWYVSDFHSILIPCLHCFKQIDKKMAVMKIKATKLRNIFFLTFETFETFETFFQKKKFLEMCYSIKIFLLIIAKKNPF